MKPTLKPFFDIVGPFLLGQASHADTVQRLYGAAATGSAAQDAQRLAIYGRFCRIHRQQALSLFSDTQQVIVDACGEPAWDALVERYFVAHPMRHFELNQNAEFFPEFLAAQPTEGDLAALPSHATELADLEWWEWLVRVAPDAPEDLADLAARPDDPVASRGPLRLASTVELRAYSYDFVSWLDADEREPSPEPGQSLVIFWRDRTLAPRRETAQPQELVIIKALIEGIPVDADLAAQVGLDWDALDETLSDLQQAGIVLGDRPT